jgi:hypothetical protein
MRCVSTAGMVPVVDERCVGLGWLGGRYVPAGETEGQFSPLFDFAFHCTISAVMRFKISLPGL